MHIAYIHTLHIVNRRNNQMLIDLVFPNYETLTIAYPEDGISCRERKESIKVEPDMFSMFDLA